MSWSHDDFMEAPEEWIPEIISLMNEEAARYGKVEEPEVDKDEIETIEMGDGTVRHQRKRTAGEMVSHSMFGIPPSYRGK